MARGTRTGSLLSGLALLLAGCWHTSHDGPPPWPHILTCYGGCAPPHYDPSACGGGTACCSACIDGTWWYSTEQQVFGCGAKLELRRGSQCVVVEVADNGPASWVESNAAQKCGGSGHIIDTSPLVHDHFGGGCGWSECFWVDVRPVPKSTPQGICATCPCGGDCLPGQTESQGCGHCGHRQRSCQGNATWGAWSACQDEGPCAPGQTEAQACGDCGTRARTCGGSCQWGDWSACEGPDPGDGLVPCDTGEPGVCAPGLVRCLQGWTACIRLQDPGDERCDGLDNDCDGAADEGRPGDLGPTLPPMAAELIDWSLPRYAPPGETISAWAEFRNRGTEPWAKGGLWLRVSDPTEGAASNLHVPGSWPAWDVAATLEQEVAAGATGRFRFDLAIPSNPGTTAAALLAVTLPEGTEVPCPSPVLEVLVSVGPEAARLEAREGPGPVAGEPREEPPLEDTPEDAAAAACGPGRDAASPWPLLVLVAAAALRRRRPWGLGLAPMLAALGLLAPSPATAEPPFMTREALICRAQSGVGFSYWWGGSCWCGNGCSPDFSCNKGGCSGNCPDCTHWGMGADCSGFVNKVWQVPSPVSLDGTCSHGPYVAASYTGDGSHWDAIPRSSLEKADALASSSHVILYESGDPWGSFWAYEAKGCSYGIVHNIRTCSSAYSAARRHNIVTGDCTPGQTQTQGCGACGTQHRTCSNAGAWGGWSNCEGQGPCAAGAVQEEACGNCGHHARSCGGNCQWQPWSACEGQGPCAAGAVQEEPCGDCGHQARGCGGDCQWQPWSACLGPDPGDGRIPCDTGEPGVCREGILRCLEGWITCRRVLDPAEELCDGLDNDCDGPADEDRPLVMGTPPPSWAAELLDLSFPAFLPPGSDAQVWVAFRNRGTEPWPRGGVWLRSGTPGAASPL
ncbi:MAG: hypothetical protein FJ098_02565, partial [Deltaproteobacteria bacterium]|nr:hypothetical protein [Deltaproteobacteria bacterium]